MAAPSGNPTLSIPPTFARLPAPNTLALAHTEWLLTDGQGGFAMGTAAAIPTRRYHGWLIASTTPPVGRVLALASCVEDFLEDPDTPQQRRHDLSSFYFPGNTVHPSGYTSLTRFEAGATVRWDYTLPTTPAPTRITRELCLLTPQQRAPHDATNAGGGGAAIVRYTIHSAGRPAALELRPLIALRDFHELLAGPPSSDRFQITTSPGVVSIEAAPHQGQPIRLNLSCTGARFVSGSHWWRDFEYPRDAERGQASRENLFSPGPFVIQINGQEPVHAELHVWTGTDPRPKITFDEAARGRLELTTARVSRALARAGPSGEESATPQLAALVAAADCFVVRRARPDGSFSASVIAGYPWFADWGRDTMICLPGLMLATGRFEEALHTLETFASLCRNGLIPNVFDDRTGTAEYNTADAPLWFIHAACRYAAESGDTAVMQGPVGRACLQIVSAYREGTDNKIRMDDDGLIMAGDATTQLTWMDARRDGTVFTPRHGKPVEINALWYNALESLAIAIDETQPRTARELRSLAEHAGASFRQMFWNPLSRSCCDVLTPERAPGRDGAPQWRPSTEIRPNQIFAASLPYSPLDAEQRAGVIEHVRTHLLTPMGLCTLAPKDPAYIARYRGPLFERDRAYHNGTVWPYLLGPFAESILRVGNFSAAACAEARQLLAPLIAELDSHHPGRLLGHIAEVYDGDDTRDEPRQPSGCPAQAWSVAEVLRVLVMVGRAEAEQASVRQAR